MVSYTLDSIVKEYLVMRGMDSPHEYPRALQAAVSTHKDMQYDVSGVPRVYTGTVEAGNKMTLPSDLIRVSRLGFMDSEGKFIEIYVDNNLVVNPNATYDAVNDTEAVQVNDIKVPIGYSQSDATSMFRNGQIIGRQYGNQGGGIYKYRMDWDRGIAEFSSNVTGQVIIEYLGDPQKIDGKFSVHPFLKDPILKGIHYRMMLFKRSYSPTEKKMAESDYLNAKHHARIRFVSQSVGNLYNAERKTFSQAPKY